MQEDRTSMLSSSETYHLRSSSNNSSMDQHNLLPNTLESEGYQHFLLSDSDTEMPNANMIGQQNANLNVWNSAGPSSRGYLVNESSCFESKREHFGPSLAVRGSLSIEGRRPEGTSSSPLQNLNIDLNLNQIDQSDAENANMVENNLESGIHPFPVNGGLFPSEHISIPEIAPDAIGSSSHTANFFDHASSQEIGVLDGRRSAFKRKIAEGIMMQSSASGSSSSVHQNKNRVLPPSTCESVATLSMPTSLNNAVSYPPVEQLNQSTDVTPSPVLSDRYLFYSDPHGTERFPRNTRMRPNEYDLPPPNLLPESSFGHSGYLPAQQQSLSFIPVQPRVFNSSASSHNGGPHVPTVTHFSQNLHRAAATSNGNLGSGRGSSSSSTEIPGQRSTSQDPNRSSMRSNFPEPLMFGSSMNASHVVQDSTNLHLASGSRSAPQNSSSTFQGAVNVGSQQMLGPNMVSQQSSSAQGSSDVTRRSLFSSGVAYSTNPSIAVQHRGNSSTSHEIHSHQQAASSRTHQHQHPYLRAAPSTERHGSRYLDLQSFMQSIASSREGSRMSELRNVVDQIRQGRNARLQDLLLIDRSLIIRRANLIDRHREMRLDVDNMSYEELLALGERIGYVSTGLSEEKIMSSLKKWKYVCLTAESPKGVEPCCICQEEYVDGEELGGLDCGHDFHSACIKQWLVIKNLCPICKNTALGT